MKEVKAKRDKFGKAQLNKTEAITADPNIPMQMHLIIICINTLRVRLGL
jgi:hypothetical protein